RCRRPPAGWPPHKSGRAGCRPAPGAGPPGSRRWRGGFSGWVCSCGGASFHKLGRLFELALVDLLVDGAAGQQLLVAAAAHHVAVVQHDDPVGVLQAGRPLADDEDRKSTRLKSSHVSNSYAVFFLEKKKIYTMSCDIKSGYL